MEISIRNLCSHKSWCTLPPQKKNNYKKEKSMYRCTICFFFPINAFYTCHLCDKSKGTALSLLTYFLWNCTTRFRHTSASKLHSLATVQRVPEALRILTHKGLAKGIAQAAVQNSWDPEGLMSFGSMWLGLCYTSHKVLWKGVRIESQILIMNLPINSIAFSSPSHHALQRPNGHLRLMNWPGKHQQSKWNSTTPAPPK